MTAARVGTVAIVGAGHAGGRAAINLRRSGFRGRITLIGDETHPPYERPPLSKALLTGAVAPPSTWLTDAAGWRALDVELRLGNPAQALERRAQVVALADGARVPYDALILATGARARGFPGTVEPDAAVHVLRTLDDVAALRPKLREGAVPGVLGAGFIGLEVASSARELGARPVVVESASRALARLLPPAFAEWLAALARAHGVELRFDTRVERLTARGMVLGSGETLATDAIVLGIGALPNVELAANAGLPVDDGVIVDASCRTADPSIFAIGDVARRAPTALVPGSRIESWRRAEDDALKVAAVLCGEAPKPDAVPWFWTDLFGRNVQLAGTPSARCEALVRGEPYSGPDGEPFIVYYFDGDRLCGAIGVDCARELRAAQKLIGAGGAVDPAKLRAPKPRPAAAAAVATG